jgi:Ca2+-binding RTX toxin-like protein
MGVGKRISPGRKKENLGLRKTALLLVFVVLAMVLARGVAWAPVINGNHDDNVLRGTEWAATMNGFGGSDILNGGGSDRMSGAAGDDTNNAVDGEQDFVGCGSGTDTVEADVVDTITISPDADLGCETVNHH